MNRVGFVVLASSAAALTYGSVRVRQNRKKNAAALPDSQVGPEERRKAGKRLLAWGKFGRGKSGSSEA